MKDRIVGHPELSVVIPCLNEEANAAAIIAAVRAQLDPIEPDFEIILIDNGSTDRTVEIIRAECAVDPRVKLIVNTRNFGQLRSPTHAIFQTTGRATIAIVADFEDPPEMIPDFIRHWREGADIVLGVGQSTTSSPLLAAARSFSYRMQRSVGDYEIIPNATGFGLYDAKVIASIARLNEPEPFFRGMLVETGFKIATISYKRALRAGGQSKNGFFSLLDFALSALAGSSKGLLRIPLYVAMFTAFLTSITLAGSIVALITGRSVQLWLWASAIEIQFTLLFLFLGLIGVQIRQIAERTRGTPLVFERERVNFGPNG